MKNNSEGKRNKHQNKLPEIAGRIVSALSARARRIGIVKLAAFSVLGILLISAASVFIWMFFIRAHKTAEIYERHYSWPSENALKGIILEDPEPFSGNDYFAFNFDNCVTNFVFTDYFAYDAVEIPGPIRSIRFMQKYFEGTLGECDEDGFPPYVIIGIDPYQTYLQSCSNKELFQKNLAFIADSASAHPDSKYCIIRDLRT